jgi:hypothetical protein
VIGITVLPSQFPTCSLLPVWAAAQRSSALFIRAEWPFEAAEPAAHLWLNPSFLQFMHLASNSLKYVNRLKAGYHNRHLITRGDRYVLFLALHAADVVGSHERLHPAVGRLQECLDSGRHDHM